MIIYSHKYALTKGIQKIEVKETSVARMFQVIKIDDKPVDSTFARYIHDNDYCSTEAYARLKAKEKAVKKLNSLNKQIKQMEKLILEFQ